MFSKPIDPYLFMKDDDVNAPVKPQITYAEFFKSNLALNKYNMFQLKRIAKAYKLRMTGTKQELLERIENFFLNCRAAEKIQRVFRGHIARQSVFLRGEGFTDISTCVNDSDFYTLEPLREIDSKYFFSFSSGKFTYGCNLISLIHLIKFKTAVKNPYNRENIPLDTVRRILNLYHLIKIIYGFPEDTPIINTTIILSIHTNIHKQKMREVNVLPSLTTVIHETTDDIDNEVVMERREKLRTMREKSFENRVQELFIEIDQLGNYTQADWFFELERYEYLRMYRALHDIWTFRGNLSRHTKRRICAVEDPFVEVQRERIAMQEVSFEVIREICLKVFEHLVYCGIDDEYRKIGTFHALSALTIVSYEARNSMRWLYESMY
jgi:hypothetical protein